MIIVSTTILSFSFKVWVDLYVLHEIIFRIGNKQSSLMFAFLFFLQIVLRYHHACCLGMIDLGVLCLGLFFDKLCATFSGMDQICVHKTTVWKGLLDNKKWMISYRQVVKPATPSNLSNIVANEEKNAQSTWLLYSFVTTHQHCVFWCSFLNIWISLADWPWLSISLIYVIILALFYAVAQCLIGGRPRFRLWKG